MPYCHKCGEQVKEDGKFCQSCGAKLEKEESQKGGRILLWISLIIGFAVAINELTWVNRSELAWVIFAVAVAVILQSVYLLRRK